MFYYTVNNNRYFNPYLAWYENFKTKSPIIFHCNELEYSTINWTQEPVESFDVLMDQHAKNIRNKYERLIFFWSGGTDSQTVLNVFSRNRIRIDEIVCLGNKRVPWFPARHIDWIKEHYWDKSAKITDWDLLDLKKRSEIIKDEKWVTEDFGDVRAFHMGAVDRQSQEHCIANHGAYKWAMLTGHEKPKLKYKNGTWWTTIEDRPVRQTMGLSNIEPFFLDPVLHLKQSHLLANVMNQMLMKFQDGDDAEELMGIRSIADKVQAKNYMAFSTACGRHQELTVGVSSLQKNKLHQYGSSIQLSLDKNIMQTIAPGANPMLVEKLKDKDPMAMNYIKGVHYLAQDSSFIHHLNENALKKPGAIFSLKPNFSKFYNLGH